MKRIIPEMQVPNCKEALEFYKELFGGEIQNLQIANNNPMFQGHEGKVMHAELVINEACVLYMNDIFGEKAPFNNISLLLQMDSKEEADRLFAVLKEGGTVQYELQTAFWGAYHGVVTDRYGIRWSLNFSQR